MENVNVEMVIESINMAKKACTETNIKFTGIDTMLQSVLELAGRILIANSGIRKEPLGEGCNVDDEKQK